MRQEKGKKMDVTQPIRTGTVRKRLEVIEGHAIDATGIAIAMAAGETAFVGQPKPGRKISGARFSHYFAY
jgi:hypothetical protein